MAIGDAMGSLHDMPILSLGAGTQNHLLPLLRLTHYLGADKVLRNIEDVTESE